MQIIQMVVVFPSKIWVHTHSEPSQRMLLSPDKLTGEPGLPLRMVWIVLLLSSVALAYSPEEPLLFDSFPDDFLWGSATAAYQVILTSSEMTFYMSLTRLRVRGMRMEKG